MVEYLALKNTWYLIGWQLLRPPCQREQCQVSIKCLLQYVHVRQGENKIKQKRRRERLQNACINLVPMGDCPESGLLVFPLYVCTIPAIAKNTSSFVSVNTAAQYVPRAKAVGAA